MTLNKKPISLLEQTHSVKQLHFKLIYKIKKSKQRKQVQRKILKFLLLVILNKYRFKINWVLIRQTLKPIKISNETVRNLKCKSKLKITKLNLSKIIFCNKMTMINKFLLLTIIFIMMIINIFLYKSKMRHKTTKLNKIFKLNLKNKT